MRSVKFLAILLSVVTILFCGCGEKSEVEIPNGYQLASDASADYYFFVPLGWTVDINSTATSAYVSSTDPSSVSVMTWTSTYSDMTLEDWWTKFTPDFEMIYDNFAVESEENLLLGGEAARSVVFTGSIGETDYKFRQISAIRDSVVYVMTYTSVADTFDLHTEEFAEMAEYFEFK